MKKNIIYNLLLFPFKVRIDNLTLILSYFSLCPDHKWFQATDTYNAKPTTTDQFDHLLNFYTNLSVITSFKRYYVAIKFTFNWRNSNFYEDRLF